MDGQTDGRTDGRTDRRRQRQFPFSLKGQGVKIILILLGNKNVDALDPHICEDSGFNLKEVFISKCDNKINPQFGNNLQDHSKQ